MSAPISPRLVIHAAENIQGGVGTYLRDLLVEQRRSFGEGAVMAVLPRSQCGILGQPQGVQIVPFDNRGPRWLSTLRLAGQMRRVLRSATPSIVHVHSTFAGLALRPLMRWMSTDTPVVYCAHGWSFDRQTSALSRKVAVALERAMAPLCHAIVCISNHERQLALDVGIPESKLVVIANGVPRESPAGTHGASKPEWPAGKRRVLFVGRFDRQKGVDLLLHALERLGDPTFAYLVGSSVLGDGASLNLPSNARATGWLDSTGLAAYYQSADVLVAPSRWEGFGLTAAEAMRARLPVVAARVGGLAEVVEHGVTGLLIEPENPDAIVAAIRSLDESTLRSMGEAGHRRFLERFTLNRAHAQINALYGELLARVATPSTAYV